MVLPNHRPYRDLPGDDAQALYWAQVRLTLKEVFGASEELATAYRGRLAKAPLDEQVLAFHNSPLQIAADLTQTEHVSQSQIQLYKLHMLAQVEQEAVPTAIENGSPIYYAIASFILTKDQYEIYLPALLKDLENLAEEKRAKAGPNRRLIKLISFFDRWAFLYYASTDRILTNVRRAIHRLFG